MHSKVFKYEAAPLWEQLESGLITCTQRNKAAIDWARTHPETSEGLVEIGTHRSEETARRCLKRAHKTKKIRLAGMLDSETGRGKNFYAGWRTQHFEHDYCLTKWCRKYPHYFYERGNNLEKRADGIVWGKAKAYLELDTGSMPLQRVKERWESYRNSDGYVIVITLSEKRLKDLLSVSSSLATVGLFCWLDKVRIDPEGAVYYNTKGIGIPIGEVM